MVVAALSAVLTAYWLFHIAQGEPDTYPAQHSGGLFLNLYLLTSSAGQLVVSPKVRIPLIIASVGCLIAALYLIFGGSSPLDTYLPLS